MNRFTVTRVRQRVGRSGNGEAEGAPALTPITTLITIRNAIPGYEHKLFIDKLADTSNTWAQFLNQNGVQLDENRFRVKCSKGKGKLSDTISVLLEGFARRSKLHVDIEEIKNGKRGRKSLAQQEPSPPLKRARRSDHHNQPVDANLPSTSTAARAFQPPRIFGINTRARGGPAKFEEDTYEFDETQFPDGRPTTSSGSPLIQNGKHSSPPIPSTNGRSRTSRENGAVTAGRFSPDGDDLSQISLEDEQERRSGLEDGEDVRARLIHFINSVPRRELGLIKEELVELKESGSHRVFKWNHYAAKACSFMFAAFDLP